MKPDVDEAHSAAPRETADEALSMLYRAAPAVGPPPEIDEEVLGAAYHAVGAKRHTGPSSSRGRLISLAVVAVVIFVVTLVLLRAWSRVPGAPLPASPPGTVVTEPGR
jgi:hypothetical protein